MTDPINKGLVDKSAVGLGERQFHINVAPGEVSTVALLPGDPFRVPLDRGIPHRCRAKSRISESTAP